MSEEKLDYIQQLLSVIPQDKIESLKRRRDGWNKTNSDLYKSSPKFTEIKRKMNDGSSFSVMDVDNLCSDMAFLASFYDHIIELEGIVIAEYALYSRYWDDNMSILSYAKIFDGTKAEIQSQIIRQIQSMKDIWEVITGIKQDLSLLGLNDSKQTSRSDSIKMMIEIYKKRHDSRKKQYESSGTRQ